MCHRLEPVSGHKTTYESLHIFTLTVGASIATVPPPHYFGTQSPNSQTGRCRLSPAVPAGYPAAISVLALTNKAN